MKRFLRLEPQHHEWLERELAAQLAYARRTRTFASPSSVEQIETNIASLEAIVGALADAE